jgi:hypothetical protein
VPDDDFMPGPIVLHDLGVIDGDVGGALIEILHWVAASGHDSRDQPVRLVDGRIRIVDELKLDHVPGLLEPVSFIRKERTNLVSLDAFLELPEPVFGFEPAALFLNCPVILRAELALQSLALAVSNGKIRACRQCD